jgi:hypothetical protein
MTKKPRHRQGLPKELQAEEDEAAGRKAEPTMDDFIRMMHGDAAVDQSGLPSREWLKEQYQTKSAAVRYLVNQGFEIKQIAKHLDMRYQHVRNVAKNPLKRGPNEDWRPKSPPPTLAMPNTGESFDDEK